MKRSWFDRVWDAVFGVSVLILVVVCLIGFAALVLPEEPAPTPAKYVCTTATGDILITTETELRAPGRMLSAKLLQTKELVFVKRNDLKACGVAKPL